MSGYWRFGDPQALIFTMIMMIILRFGLLLVVFYDEFPFPYWKEHYFYSFIVLATPFWRPRESRPLWGSRPPRLGNPGLIHHTDNFLPFLQVTFSGHYFTDSRRWCGSIHSTNWRSPATKSWVLSGSHRSSALPNESSTQSKPKWARLYYGLCA